MNKDKLILIISIGLTALVLSGITFLQFKTVEQTDITAIETMRETELRTELSSWKAKYDEISLKLAETEKMFFLCPTHLLQCTKEFPAFLIDICQELWCLEMNLI